MTEKVNTQLTELTTELQIPEAVSDLVTKAIEADPLNGAVGLKVGDVAPDFELPDATGSPVRLADLLAQGKVIVSFYRGEWCPYCNLTLRNWQNHKDDIANAGAQLVAITPQRPSNALTLTAKHDLAFPVLSDLDQSVVRAYRLRHDLSPALKDLYQNAFGLDMTELNADGTWSIVVPGTYVIDRGRHVRFADADLDWRRRAEPEDVLAALRD